MQSAKSELDLKCHPTKGQHNSQKNIKNVFSKVCVLRLYFQNCIVAARARIGMGKVYFPNVFFQSVCFEIVFSKLQCGSAGTDWNGQSVFSKMYFSKVYVLRLYFQNCSAAVRVRIGMGKVYFSKCIFPKCIF